ncbi:MAG: (d)CMP kinase [Acidobacteriota bacterium]|nr:MAG: (d)CMP kinase [Acidobacteriota bacterium]
MGARYVVALDGPAGVGKSTVARTLAQRLGAVYVSSGLVYRAAAWGTLHDGVSADDAEAVWAWLNKRRIELRAIGNEAHVFLDGENLTERLHTLEVSERASRLAALPEVRQALIERQREMAERHPAVVMEGRDIGSAIFPDTPYKFYLEADEAERARRRLEELRAQGAALDHPKVQEAIRSRDALDSSRSTAPLRVPEGAHTVDTTDLGVPKVVEKILKHMESMSFQAAQSSERPG